MSNFKIDDPVMVRNNKDKEWIKGYFAGFDSEGFAYAWLCGQTSWTAYGEKNRWNEYRSPTEEELKITRYKNDTV